MCFLKVCYVFSSKSTLTSITIVRNFCKTLLEYRVEFPQMGAPNGWHLKAFKGLKNKQRIMCFCLLLFLKLFLNVFFNVSAKNIRTQENNTFLSGRKRVDHGLQIVTNRLNPNKQDCFIVNKSLTKSCKIVKQSLT